MADPFTEAGLPARFELDEATLSAAQEKAQASGPAVQNAVALLSDRRQRAEALLNKLGAPPAEQWIGLPSGFDSTLAELRAKIRSDIDTPNPADVDAVKVQIEKHWLNIAHYFQQLAGYDKGPVQAGRQRAVRSELNAIDALTQLLP